MMKKLLVLFMVLGLTTMANAALQISVNGDPEPIDGAITLGPSDEIILDIWTDADLNPFEIITWQLIVDTSLGSITPGVALGYGDYGSPPETQNAPDVISPEGQEGIWGLASNLELTPVPAGTVLFDQIVFHCEGDDFGAGTVISLMDAPEGVMGSILYDSVLIYQTPEPITIALLGLGGLFLRRRK